MILAGLAACIAEHCSIPLSLSASRFHGVSVVHESNAPTASCHIDTHLYPYTVDEAYGNLEGQYNNNKITEIKLFSV